MKVKDLLKEEIDIDVFDDYDERCNIAFCGPCKLTAKGRKKFASIMNNDVKIFAPMDVAVISCENEHEAQLAKYLFHGFAGFIPSDEWETLFVED